MAAATVEELRSCLRAVSDAEALDRAGAGTRIADVLDSFARVRLVPELEDRFRVRLQQADLAPEHWETLGTLLARLNHIRDAR
jgi:acyl carrier protein